MPSKQEISGSGNIEVYGARVHNLKNIDVKIPRNKFTVITGLSGSGKSSLAFDVIHAEGQRRYVETMSAYARQFLGNLERPDVDKITGLSPVISIEQKTTNKNPRSTVGTVTEIYDFLRLLYARAGIAYSYNTGEKMVKYSDDQIIKLIIETFENKKTYILAPLVQGRKGHYRELFDQLRKKGFLNVRINGEIKEITFGMRLDRYKTHHIELVVDKLIVQEKDKKRLRSSVDMAMKMGKNITLIYDSETDNARYFSKQLMCPTTGISYNEPAPYTFSFNSPHGACHACAGLGEVSVADISKIIPNKKISIKDGAIEPLGKYKPSLIFWQLDAIASKFDFDISTPFEKIPPEAVEVILYGSEEAFRLKNSPLGDSHGYFLNFEGIVNYVMNYNTDDDNKSKNWSNQFIEKQACNECNGTRLSKEALYFKIHDKNIAELSAMDIDELYQWFSDVEKYLDDKQLAIATEILKEIKTRIRFLLEVGLNYLSLNRSARSLSGGESQRIRLATQIGSQLVNVLYILDEPSIGLHQRDNHKLIESLKKLRDTGNTIVVVEHDKDTILSADYVVDLGPKAGRLGGEVIGSDIPANILNLNSLTAQYLNNTKQIEIPLKRRKGNGNTLSIIGARGNNLKNINVDFPLGKFICITGVSGSGKSSLINETLYPVLSKHFYKSIKSPLEYNKIIGINYIDKVIEVNQAPIGRTPRSNPATYTGVFSDIRNLFVLTTESRIRGYKPGRFSFNVKGGRCETCKGAGIQTIEMNFLPDVYVTCNECYGKRYNKETLEVKYKGKNINDVLNMTINQAVEFFENIPAIYKKIKTLQDVGLGYITLGQQSTTLSGGESQRIKLAAELAKKDTGKTLYILDEPTTGLHFEDISVLLGVLQELTNRGNTIIVIEHNLDVIKVADYIIDLGPEGGSKGGEVVCTGSPEEIVTKSCGHTAMFLKNELN